MQAITDELHDWLKEGWIVEVGELGHFSLSLKSDHPVMKREEIHSPSIQLQSINLRIGSKFNTMELERIESPFRPHSLLTDAKCEDKLVKYLEEKSGIRHTEYMLLTALSRKRAITHLNHYINKGVLRKFGSGKVIVYLKN